MKTFAAVLAVAAGVATATTPAEPVFAKDWTGVVAQHVVINQGGVANPDGSVTCPAQAPQCKVQTAFQGARQFVSVTQQKQKIAAPDNSGIVIDIAAGKEYQVDSTNTCTGYCPLPKNFGNIQAMQLFPNSTYQDAAGNQWCNGKTPCSAWVSVQKPLLNITFETDTFYTSGNTPLSVYEQLTPFGIPMGYQSTQFLTYTAGAINPSVFAVQGTSNTTSCALLQCNSGDGDGDQDGDGDGDDGMKQHKARALGVNSASLATALPTFTAQADVAAAFKVAAAEHPEVAAEYLAGFPAEHPIHAAM